LQKRPCRIEGIFDRIIHINVLKSSQPAGQNQIVVLSGLLGVELIQPNGCGGENRVVWLIGLRLTGTRIFPANSCIWTFLPREILKLNNTRIVVIVWVVNNGSMLIIALGKCFEFKMYRAVGQETKTITEKSIGPAGINQYSIESLPVQTNDAVRKLAYRFEGGI